MKTVIGLVGRMGAGKSVVSKYICEKYGANEYRFSQILVDILDRLYLPHRREYLQELGACLRKIREDCIVRALKKDLERDESNLIVIDGIRYFNEVELLRSFDRSYLICIKALPELRFERIKNRREKEEPPTFEEFLKKEEAETEKKIDEICKEAEFVVKNNSTLEDLYAKIDKIMNRILYR